MDLISVIVPVFNTKDYINECLDSIVNQSYEKLEIIIVDDGSTDGSLVCCKEYEERDSRVKVVSQENKGSGSAILTGLNLSSGKYIAFVDSDDYIKEDMISILYNCICETNSDCVRCGGSWFDEDGFTEFEVEEYKELNKEEIETEIINYYFEEEATMFKNWSAARWDKIYKADLLKRAMKNTTKNIVMGDDVFMNLKFLSLADKIVSISNSNLYMCRVRKGSLTRGFRRNLFMQNIIFVNELEKIAKEQFRDGKALTKLKENLVIHSLLLSITNLYSYAEKVDDINQMLILVKNKKSILSEVQNWGVLEKICIKIVINGNIRLAVLISNMGIKIKRIIQKNRSGNIE